MTFNILLLQDTATPWGLDCWWWWLFSLLAFLLGALLYWLLFCRGKQAEIDRLTGERDGLKAQFTNMEKDYMSLKYQYDEAQKEIARLKGALQSCEADKAVLATKLTQAAAGDGDDTNVRGFVPGLITNRDTDGPDYAAIFQSDNLQVIEGVGPKIEELLKNAGLTDWSAVAVAPVEKLQQILDGAGSNYRLADPQSWPRQAELARDGKWAELIEYQKFLDTGSAEKGDFETPSKVEKLVAKKLGFSTNPEDLKIVEGIGPKIEGLLKEAGINNWSDLAAATEAQLRELLANAGERYRLADPTTWPRQAELARDGKWEELSQYQEFLAGGKEPE